MCFRLGPFKSMTSFPVITIQFNKLGQLFKFVFVFHYSVHNMQYESRDDERKPLPPIHDEYVTCIA